MRRRELLAGIGSLGILAAGGAVAMGGASSIQSSLQHRFGPDVDQLELETVDARGSEPGTIALPSLEQPTFIDFFGTWCPPCVEQMPALADAHDHLGDTVTFVSVTLENAPDDDIADWWGEHDGQWTIARDRTAELAERYGLSGYPYAVAIDEHGVERWSDAGVKTADELIDGIERAL
ncbi:TlpA family protein disulfide reductase [Natronosalvus vescus]|uniref:TlpA family protein disulfide reductase n=1 Tax=Natronosalvus vescus TaxID=2953881 RepID=UPI00209031D0|nr:TlpA disulfide reductase family protein [Natronosalvus vescus]